MDRKQIGVYAGKVWQLLSNNEKWGYGTLKRKSGLKDKELGLSLIHIQMCIRDRISGTWAFTIKSAAFGKDNLNSTLNIAKTASWTDYRGKVMWADGAEKAQGTTEWGAKPLSVYGFTAPRCV